MKKLNLIFILLIPLIFMGCNDGKKNNSSSQKEIVLEVDIERDMSSGYPLDIIFKLTNLSDKTVYYQSFDILGDGITLKYFAVTEDGTVVRYKGITYSRTAIIFDSLDPGESYSVKVSLDRMYTITKGSHNYKINFLNSILAKHDNKPELLDNDYLPNYPNALTENNHTSKLISIKSNTLEFEATINEIRNFN